LSAEAKKLFCETRDQYGIDDAPSLQGSLWAAEAKSCCGPSLFETAGEQFFWLYYADGWRDCYAEHREEIDAEWRRGWTAKKKAFVMTSYFDRGMVLSRDREREIRRQRRVENGRADAYRDDAGPHGSHEEDD
jgi:hypothetical protein